MEAKKKIKSCVVLFLFVTNKMEKNPNQIEVIKFFCEILMNKITSQFYYCSSNKQKTILSKADLASIAILWHIQF